MEARPARHYEGRSYSPTTRWLVRFGYDGSEFGGWARQPRVRTIEGVLRDGLRCRAIASTPEDAELEVASRTDRGVSARANALTLRTALDGPVLLRRLNTIAPSLFFTAAASVPAAFRVRGATRRVYRYFDPRSYTDLAGVQAAAQLFRGRIDVRSFGRSIRRDAPQWRSVESVAVTPTGSGQVVEVRALSFVWGMVRKIVGALREVDTGHLSTERLGAAIAGQERLTLPMAEPEGLVLWEVEFPLPWAVSWWGPNRHQAEFYRSACAAVWRRGHVVDALLDGGARPGPDRRGDGSPSE